MPSLLSLKSGPKHRSKPDTIDPQSVRSGTGQQVDFLKTEPEGGSDGSKPGPVVGPRQLPLGSHGVWRIVVNDDPAEYRHDGHEALQRRNCYVVRVVPCNVTCETISTELVDCNTLRPV